MPPVVHAENLTKTFELFDGPVERLRCRLGVSQPRRLTAVQNVSFEVEPGRAFGIVGENGAGKSTLLRLIAGITRPTSGSCHVRGRIGSILELGAGFHPELTGRQNIRLSAALAGLDPNDVGKLSEEIIGFSELEAFIDEPVKRYSAGMTVRLAFAIASQSAPDLLIVDEALSVGDGRFQKKCLDRVRQFLETGGALLLSTHALYYLTSLCDRALWLRQGRVVRIGSAVEVAAEYDAYLRRTATESAAAFEASAGGAAAATIEGIRVIGGEPDGESGSTFQHRDRWGFEVEVASTDETLGLHLAIGVNTEDGREVFACSTHRDGLEALRGRKRYRARLLVPELPLCSGGFQVHVYLLDESGLHVYGHTSRPDAFRVRGSLYSPALIDPGRTWDWPADA